MQELFFYIDAYDENRGRIVRFNILKDTEKEIFGKVKYYAEEENLNSYDNRYSYSCSKTGLVYTFYQQYHSNQKFPILVIREDNFKNIDFYNKAENNVLYCSEYSNPTKY